MIEKVLVAFAGMLSAGLLGTAAFADEQVCIEPAVGYNCWPMIQSVHGRLVCAYTSGSRHDPGEPGRGTYARVSVDGGKSWSARVTVVQDPKKGQTPVAKGLDENGDMLLWVRCYGGGPLMTLYRTKDGVVFDVVARPELDGGPMMQITDVFRLPTVGLMAFWFGGSYADDNRPRRWGTMTSADNGKTWIQRVCGENMGLGDWPTEPAAFYAGNGRIFCIARTEAGTPQLQLTSADYGKTWKIARTNIRDVRSSTPSLLYDGQTGRISNYYYHRGPGRLNFRCARLSDVWDNAEAWPAPATLVADGGQMHHAGNVNVTSLNGKAYAAYYTGTESACAIMLHVMEMAKDYYVDSARGNDENDGRSPAKAWRSLAKVNAAPIHPGDTVRFRRGCLWRGTVQPHSGRSGMPVTYTTYGRGTKPIIQNSVDRSSPSDWIEERPGFWSTAKDDQSRRELSKDVGILIVNHGERWGFKKWKNPEWTVAPDGPWKSAVVLENDLDYWYDPSDQRVTVKYPTNPGEAFESIELALTAHVFCTGGWHDAVCDGLWIRYGAAHGLAGDDVANLVVRNCDICWMGGGLQFWKRDNDGKILYPIRYGNGIELWDGCRNCLIERCRLWEVYDAALTNQGLKGREVDIVWRNNVIWNCEYSFESWNGGVTSNVLFEHNTCVDAGRGWAHAQRPDPNGAHLMYYSKHAATTNFVVRNNIFCRATDWTVRSGEDWRTGLTHEGNLIYNDGDVPVLRWLDGRWLKLCDWATYRDLGFDGNGLFAEPVFRNPAKRDYRLCADSSNRMLGSDGRPVGARNVPGLDEDQSN